MINKNHEKYLFAIRFYLVTNKSSKIRLCLLKKIFGIKRSTFYYWYKIYKTNNNSIPIILNKKKKAVKSTKYILFYIKRYVCRFKNFLVTKVINKIMALFGIKISKSYFYQLLKMLKFTRKKLYIKKVPKTANIQQKKKIFAASIQRIKNTGDLNKLISIDETAIYLNCKLGYGWSLIGKRCVIYDFNPRIYQKKYSLIVGISNSKIIHYEIHKESIKGAIYLEFIKKIIKKTNNDAILLMDNATIHKTKLIKEYLQTNNVSTVYNIPYNPESNPIEMLFSPLKNHIKKNNTKTLNNIKQSLNDYLNNVKPETLSKLFTSSLSKYY